MTSKNARNLFLFSNGLLLLGLLLLLSWRLAAWNRDGWVGVSFMGPSGGGFGQRLFTHSHEVGRVFGVFEGGPAWHAGFRSGDKVLAVNGIEPTAVASLRELAGKIGKGETLAYRLDRNGRKLWISVTPENPLQTKWVAIKLTVSAAEIVIFLVIGVLVFLRKPRDRRARVFYLLSVVACALLLTNTLSDVEGGGNLGLVEDWRHTLKNTLDFNLSGLLFALVLHLALVFPKPRPILEKWPGLLRATYALLSLFIVLSLLNFLRADWSSISMMVVWGLFVISAVIVCFGFTAFACVALLRSYRESTAEEKRQLRWPLWGTAAAISLPFLAGMLQGAVEGSTNSKASFLTGHVRDLLSQGALLLIPVSFAFAISKYRLMEIDRILKKTVVYGLMTIILFGSYFVLVGVLGGVLIRASGLKSQWVIIGATLMVAAMLVPVRNLAQSVVERKFFRRKYDYPEALKDLARDALEGQEIEAFVQGSVERLQMALQNRSAVLFVKEHRGGLYRPAAKVGVSDELLERLRFRAGDRLVEILGSGLSPKEKDLPKEERRKLREAGGAFVLPIRFERELVGFVTLGSKLDGEEYDGEDLEFLSAVSDQLATGLARSWGRERAQEFDQARLIQEGLLPKDVPQVPGYQICGTWLPAREVGGDYFDVLRFDDSRVGICIGDVVGKGMPAALLMSNLQAVVRALASPETSPAELCRRIDRILRGSLTGGKFITFFFAFLEARERRVRYCNAGHAPPIVMRADGGHAELTGGGPALGAFSQSVYQEGELTLSPGDTMILFTDGLTEAIGDSEESFGEERLIRVLAENRGATASELQRKVMDALAEFSGGRFSDDVTVVVVAAR